MAFSPLQHVEKPSTIHYQIGARLVSEVKWVSQHLQASVGKNCLVCLVHLIVFVTEQGLQQGSQFIYSKLASSVISCWTTIISWLNKMRWIFLSLSLGIFQSDNKAFTLNFTSMVEVTDCLSSFFCNSLPTSAALSALTPAFAALVNPVENDTSNCLSWLWSKGLFSSSHVRASATVLASLFIHALARSLWSGQCFLTPSSMNWLISAKWFSFCTQYMWPESLLLILPLLNPPFDFAAFISLCSIHMSQINHGKNNKQCGSHKQWNFQKSHCN